MAVLAIHEGDARRSANLLGAIEAALQALHVPMEPVIVPFHKETLAAVREQLGESAFQSAWEEGSQWLLDEAVSRALEDEWT